MLFRRHSEQIPCESTFLTIKFDGFSLLLETSGIPLKNFSALTSVVLVSTAILAGCATSSDKIAAAYVSPLQYQSYDCEQLSAESQRLHQRVTSLQGQVDSAAANDKAITGVGMILFWPALFALGGNQQQEADYGRLKGEHDAIQQAAVMKKCSSIVSVNVDKSTAPIKSNTVAK
jgi:hypothetical protein